MEGINTHRTLSKRSSSPHPAELDRALTVTMEVVVVENIYLLVIVTLISVLQNGEEQPEQ